MQKKKSNRLIRITLLAILIAIELLMAFTPIGYLRFGVTSVTLLPVPVAIGAILLGPTAGGILGAVFGLTSFYQCFGMDALGVLLLDISPVATFLLTVVTRILMGVCVGWLYKGLSKIKGKYFPTVAAIFSCAFVGLSLSVLFNMNGASAWNYLIGAVGAILIGFLYHFIASLDATAAPSVLSACSAAVLNTLFFVSALVLLFGNNPKVLEFTGQSNAWGIVVLLVTLNAVIEAAVCLVIGTAVSKALLALQQKVAKPAAPQTEE
jgi:uncharacterized membrane protein